MNLSDDVQFLKGVGPHYAAKLAEFDVRTVEELLRFFPTDYTDRGALVPLGRAQPYTTVTVEGRVKWIHATRARMPVAKARIEDATGWAEVVFFNQPWVTRTIHVGDVLTVSGEMREGRELHPRAWEAGDEEEEAAHAAGLVPRYGVGSKVPMRWFRKLVRRVVDEFAAKLVDPLPGRRRLLPLQEAVAQLHFPDSWERREEARRSMAYEELFAFESMMALRRAAADAAPGVRIPVPAHVDARIRARLPFAPTAGQEAAIAAIRDDLGSGRPMNRLLQGDVGCGKTAVAATAILAAIAAKHRAALMAPTDLLAEQHVRTFERWLEGSSVRIGWVRGRMAKKARAEALGADLVIGTHALLEEDVAIDRLALAVIDEQQRFGVAQRAALVRKAARPHVLVMTATPIPRTLAMTLYGDLDVTVIREMPPGRRPVTTLFETSRAGVIERVRARLRAGEQAFFVYPLIDDSDKLPLKAAKAAVAEIAAALPEFRTALLHGKMKRDEKDRTMGEFRDGAVQVLVSTVVIEVGIDVPNATIMVVDHAERYGLAQLHQLRGRIGRGTRDSTCVLLGDPRTPDARARVEAMVRHADGFTLAEEDLKIRGPGELFGTRQSGMPFRLADPVRDIELLAWARDDAFAHVRRDPEGAKRLRKLFSERLKLATIG